MGLHEIVDRRDAASYRTDSDAGAGQPKTDDGVYRTTLCQTSHDETVNEPSERATASVSDPANGFSPAPWAALDGRDGLGGGGRRRAGEPGGLSDESVELGGLPTDESETVRGRLVVVALTTETVLADMSA